MTMEITRTIKIKLGAKPIVFQPTVDLYTDAFNYVCKVGYDSKDFNGVSLHHKTYPVTKTYLPSQLAISSRMKATEALKGLRKKIRKNDRCKKNNKPEKRVSCPQSNGCSIRYDARSYNVWFDRNEISILTVDGRKRFPLIIPEYFKQYVDWKRTSADLFIRKDKVFINIAFTKKVRDIIPCGRVVGIDRGVNKLAVTSDNVFHTGGQVKRISKKYDRIKSKLKQCGSQAAKRHLKKISNKENRFRTDTNHIISKQIVESLNKGDVIAIEQLKGIKQGKRLSRKGRKKIHGWSFFQLEQFLTYKAEGLGIAVKHVDARYTSQKCSVCGYISRSNRLCQSNFKCKQCGFSLNADLNASRNIRQNYLNAIRYSDRGVVNHPIVESDVDKDSKLSNCVNA